jgi:hypothetical protein
VKVNIEGVKTREYFEVTEIMDESEPYPLYFTVSGNLIIKQP